MWFEYYSNYFARQHQLLISGEGADFIIEVDGRTFNVHKFILSAHSDVLRAMVTHRLPVALKYPT